jgi:autotransporter-associated beta strand protein
VPNLCERIRLRWLLPVCAVLFLLAAAPKASAAGFSMTISTDPTTGGSCSGETWLPSGDGANLNVNDIAACAGGGPVTIGNGGAIDVLDWPSSLGVAVTLDGAATIETSMSGFSGLTVEGATSFTGAADVTTSGAQDYTGAVTMPAGTDQLDASAVTFDSTLDGASSNANLTLTASGSGAGSTVTFEQSVGSIHSLASLDVVAPGTITVSGEVFTAGAQTYGSAVELAGDVEFANGSGAMTFDSTIDGAHALTVSGAGADYFGGAIGSESPLTSIDVTNGTGSTELPGNVTTTGSQQFAEDLTLGNDVTFSSSSSVTLFGIVSGAHEITMSGGGTLDLGELSQSSDSFAGTVVTGGSMVSFALGALGTGPITLNDGTLAWTNQNTSDVSSQLQIGAGGGTLDSNGFDLSFANSIEGSGPLTKTGAGTLTLNAPTGSYGSRIVVHQGSVAVPAGTAVTTPVAIDSGGTLNCDDGTLMGGVTNNGGTATGAPAAPTAVNATPGFEAATLSFTEAAPNCYPISYTVTAGGLSWTPGASPTTLRGLTGNKSYTFTLTATNPIGSASSSSNTITAGPFDPSAAISSPANGASFSYGQIVDAAFSCQDGAGGLGIQSCVGSEPLGFALRMTTPGQHTFTVTATSLDGLTASTTVTYTVLAPPNSFKVRSVKANHAGTITISLSSLREPGKIVATGRVTKLPAFSVRKSVFTTSTSTLTLTLPPSKRLKALLKKHRSVSVKLTIAYTPTNGTTRNVVRSIRVK